MGVKETIDYDPTEELVEEGRRALAEGRTDEARFAFTEVLKRRPDHPRALLAMAYLDRSRSDVPPEPSGSVLSIDEEIVTLVQQKQYEEALVLLERARLERPDDEAVRRSRDHIRSHLMKKWTKALGGDKAMVALYEPNMDHPLGLRMPAKLSELIADEDQDPFETLRTLIDWKEEKLLRSHVQRRPTPIFTERGDPLALVAEKERAISAETNVNEGMSAASMFYGALVILVAGVVALWLMLR